VFIDLSKKEDELSVFGLAVLFVVGHFLVVKEGQVNDRKLSLYVSAENVPFGAFVSNANDSLRDLELHLSFNAQVFVLFSVDDLSDAFLGPNQELEDVDILHAKDIDGVVIVVDHHIA